ncbi:hypothetical protein QN277_002401 [Acacia crassicarpa]|uniref:Translation initiation factor IF-2, chloroplastic n=1 Tax=Acacia crassicarpa TaxID=499986 RepID=A0AAE1N990_9FABA|nr:hypothetical protein QN277_002401 [Acacia crassicarpa]
MHIMAGNAQGAMSYLASPVSLGGFVGVSSSGRTLSIGRRVSLSGANFKGRRTWRCVSLSLCRYSVTTTDFILDQGNAMSLDSNSDRGSTGNGDNNAGFVLKPPPKPVLKSSETKGNSILGANSEGWDPSKAKQFGNEKFDDVEERNKVIESLGEVLEKAEKLENSKLDDKRNNGPVSKPAVSNTIANPNTDKLANSTANQQSRTVKSVWRKGDTVANMPKVVKEVPKPQTKNGGGKSQTGGGGKAASQLPTPPQAPQPPSRPQPMLQAKPSVAPPPIKKPVLKDNGAAGTRVKDKERKPILIDKFANKKAAVDPIIAQAVLAPTKPGKGPPPGKFKDDFRKKGAPAGRGPRRRIIDIDDVDDIPGAASARKGRKWSKASRKAARLQAAKDAAPVKVEILEVSDKGMLIEELAYNLAISEGEILGSLYSKGIKPDGVQTLDKDMVKMICKEQGVEVLDTDPVKVEGLAKKREILDEDDLDKLKDRPPVITIMGHVDHGKTTLLDHIRKSKVAASEAGGITQGIGAYKVQVPVDGKMLPCVFLDTPGHEAFGAMRARGASVTDIAIIVVAADDGIRPQTNEAIAHAKAAGVPIIMAINKIDKDGANPDRVMQELSSIGLMPEEWGGDIPMVQISALKGENIDDLLETVMLVAEVRALFDDVGKRVDSATPSIPIQVIGLNNVPIAGDEFEVVDSLVAACEKAESRAESLRNERISAKAGDGKVTLSSLASAVSAGKLSGLDLHQLNIILKVDLQGTIEAIRQALQVLPQDNVTLKFLLEATGDVSTSDVDLAVASKAIILGFNVKVSGSVKSYAENKFVEIRSYKVIYDLIDDVRNAMEGLLEPVEEQVQFGSAEVRATFSSGSGRVAGCMVTDGKVSKDCGIRVIRRGKVVHLGVLDSLRRVKESVKEVSAGLECGIGLEDYDDWEEGDIIEAFNTVQKKRTLEEASASMAAAVEGVEL